ncbi:hypothetical protein OJ996_18790 [Luteolibacter sp. GHJ8]|uniref:Alpha/beta hydrolase n=1 Tax=Luteolibacter rhizosphaerae TaxID=2989719 RepID=A0ABT3G718_9BACT|nr:hypothetical protein [Luteolibacter rhizosphaerae]MCW1915640.1 hypothetical protein [Luteolibacter rhizosphaerae]
MRLLSILLLPSLALAYEDPAPKRYDLQARASAIDPQAKEHPEISFAFTKDGKPADLQHACVDTRVPDQGKLVIWLMGHNQGLFERVSSYGLHAIQVHYANGWFSQLYSGAPPADDLYLSKIRLEAATGEDLSDKVSIPKPDSIMGRSVAFVKWLDRENPQGGWKQFLTEDGKDLRWEKVILSGISHGSTTAARMAKQVKVDRVVMFSGPRDQYEAWQSLPSATPGKRFFAFTHVLDDGWENDHYCRSWQMLKLQDYGPLVNVENTPPPFGNSRRLISDADVKGDAKRAHSGVVPGGQAPKDEKGKYLHEEVWRYLFTHPVEQTGEPVPADPDCRMEQRKK